MPVYDYHQRKQLDTLVEDFSQNKLGRRQFMQRALAAGLSVSAAASLLVACGGTAAIQTSNPFGKINHFIILYQENWSFDSLYPSFPGADGISNASPTSLRQVDKTGKPYTSLPQPLNNGKPDTRFPTDLPVKPFETSLYVATDQRTGDLVGRFYQEQSQIDGGKMDKFIPSSNAGGLVMSYYDSTNLSEGKLAQQYTMADRFFHAAYGGSLLNHFWLICATTPRFPNAPASMVAQLDAAGNLVKDGAVTPDGYLVNTAYTVNTPHPAGTKPETLVPLQTMPNIGDRLTEKNISWAWYSGGWNDALAGHPDPLFQFHHQPFAYFASTADGKPAKAQHLKDEQDFLAALKNGTLPAVSFVKPLGTNNEHPGYATELAGQVHVAELVKAVQNSSHWKDTAIIITYDENGGRWDHVSPPTGGRWGPGTRVPAIIISPFAKNGVVDHTVYDTTSILRTIEVRWNLPAFGTRDAKVNDLRNALPLAVG